VTKAKKGKGFTEASVNRWIEYIRQMKAKSGPFYEKWREGMRRWYEEEFAKEEKASRKK